MHEPGPLLASGRDADIFEYGTGLVMRRSRGGRSMNVEARVMEYVREHGYPAPEVHELSRDGTELVMERIEGPSMLALLGARPWTLRRQAFVLAKLHGSLHELNAPRWVNAAPCGEGDQLVHMDLHPANIIVSRVGPVVIDWSNAARGDGDVDAALTWLLLSAGDVQASPLKSALVELGRSRLIAAFLKRFDRAKVAAQLPGVVAWKLSDPHMSSDEQAAMRSLLSKEMFRG